MKKPHYAWIVCISSLLLIFISMGTVSNSFSVYLPFIMREHGFTNAQTSFLVTLRCLVSFFCMLMIGLYYKKVSIKTGSVLAALSGALVFLIYGLADSYAGFCLGAALSGFTYGTGSMIPVSILLNRWFDSHTALAISIASAGSGMGTIVLSPLVTVAVEKLSLKTTFFFEALLILILSAAVFILMKNYPEEKGLKPLGFSEEAADNTQEASSPPDKDSAVSCAQNDGLPSFRIWLLIGAVCIIMGAVSNPGFSHLSVLFRTAGYSSATAAAVISIVGFLLIVAKLLFGSISDRLGGLNSGLIFLFILTVGHVLCCFASYGSPVLVYITALVLGTGYPVATIGIAVWAKDLASKEMYPKMVRRMQVIYAGGALMFSGIPGIMADHFGDYIPAYLLFSVLIGLTLICLPRAYILAGKKHLHR